MGNGKKYNLQLQVVNPQGKKTAFYMNIKADILITACYKHLFKCRQKEKKEEMHVCCLDSWLQIGQPACSTNLENKLNIELRCDLKVSGWDAIHYKWHIHWQEAARIGPLRFQLETGSRARR